MKDRIEQIDKEMDRQTGQKGRYTVRHRQTGQTDIGMAKLTDRQDRELGRLTHIQTERQTDQ